ncbi:MAG: antitoxin [Candidatus Thiodubiliella endoseptemdiera]|uniref:Antitoxin n=1 Tax=Candidatus Thiodubiliella endoseptemdiera TaxID=2738886 RepID=A0A853F383_9GAMM|nr:antitoxin [Candidatus Thiodubiliella endoseptemdiera]
MKKISIETATELKNLKDFEQGHYVELEKNEFDELNKSLKEAATNTITKLSKKKSISIRLLEDDINRLKAIAMNEGMPYQTYISYILHKVTTGRINTH